MLSGISVRRQHHGWGCSWRLPGVYVALEGTSKRALPGARGAASLPIRAPASPAQSVDHFNSKGTRWGAIGGSGVAPPDLNQYGAAISRRVTNSRAWWSKSFRAAAGIGSPGMNFSLSGFTNVPLCATR